MQLTTFDDIQKHHRHIFLSPHFDDVVYSCGGTLGVQVYAGLHPLVITVFGGTPDTQVELSPFAQQIHRSMGFRQDITAAIQARRQEDANVRRSNSRSKSGSYEISLRTPRFRMEPGRFLLAERVTTHGYQRERERLEL